jgi:hypothetical protein
VSLPRASDRQKGRPADRSAVPASPEELDRLVDVAADYIAPIRDAAGPAARMRAAAAKDGASALMTLLRALPVEQATFSRSPEGEELRRWFRPDRSLPVDRAPVALLTLPATHREHLQGRSRQALRTNLTRAAEAGLKATVANSPADFLQAAAHIAVQRGTTAGELVPLALREDLALRCRIAYDDHGAPVGISQTVRDGDWAGLAMLVTSHGHPQAQAARYLLHSQVVEDLIDQEVSRLVVGGSLLLATSGTRYFQRRNGYRPVRLRIPRTDSRRRGTTGA